MSDTQITLEFLANTDGLKAAAQQLQLLGKVSKEQYAQFTKANRDAQQAIAAMAKEIATTGRVLNETAPQATLLNTQFRQMGQFIATGAINELNTHFLGLGMQIVDNADKLTALNNQLKELQQAINSNKLEGEALAKAKDNAADLLGQIKDTTETAEKLGEAFKADHLKLFGSSLNLAVSGLAAAQSGAVLFGVENEKLEQTLTKLWAAMSLANGAIQFASTATEKGGIAAMAYNIALQVVDKTQKALAISSAAAWAVVTGGIGLAVAGIAAFISYVSDAGEATTKFSDEQYRQAKEDLEAQESIRNDIHNRIKQQDADFFKEMDRLRKDDMIAGKDAADAEFNVLSRIIDRYNDKLKSYSVYGAQQNELTTERAQEINDIIRDATLAKEQIYKNGEQARASQAKEAYRKQIELTIRMLELQRVATLKGSEEDIALFKKVQAQKLELAKLSGAGNNEQAIIKAEQENALQQYIGAQLKAKQDAHQQGMEQLRQNAAEEAAFIEEFEKHKLEIQQAYETMSIEEFRKWVEEKRKAYEQQDTDTQNALAQLKANHAADEALLRQYRITLKEIDDDYVQFQNETGQTSYENFVKWEKEKIASKKKTTAEMAAEDDAALAAEEEKRKAIKAAENELAIQTAQATSDAVFSILQTQWQAETSTRVTALEKQRQAELDNKNLTEAEKVAINDKYNKKIADLKRKDFERNKAASVIQAIINTALAVVNAITTGDPYTAAIRAAMAGALGAAQIAVISAQPVPQFARGGKNIPAGMKLVGEEGPELIWTPGGETVIPHGDTARILEAWSIPVPNINPALKTDMAIAAALPVGIDYTKLAVVLAQELRNNPAVNINMDSNGFGMHLIQKSRTVHLLNNRYSA